MQYSRNSIHDVYVAADRLVNSGKCTGDDVLGITKPFLDCTHVEGISEEFQSDSIGLLYALTGDGFRVARRFSESAEWYEQASRFTCIHGEIFAHMVWRNRMVRYYRSALETAKRKSDHQQRMSFVARINEVIVKWPSWFDREWIDIWMNRRKTLMMLEAELARRAEPGATDNPDDAQRLREDH